MSRAGLAAKLLGTNMPCKLGQLQFPLGTSPLHSRQHERKCGLLGQGTTGTSWSPLAKPQHPRAGPAKNWGTEGSAQGIYICKHLTSFPVCKSKGHSED